MTTPHVSSPLPPRPSVSPKAPAGSRVLYGATMAVLGWTVLSALALVPDRARLSFLGGVLVAALLCNVALVLEWRLRRAASARPRVPEPWAVSDPREPRPGRSALLDPARHAFDSWGDGVTPSPAAIRTATDAPTWPVPAAREQAALAHVAPAGPAVPPTRLPATLIEAQFHARGTAPAPHAPRSARPEPRCAEPPPVPAVAPAPALPITLSVRDFARMPDALRLAVYARMEVLPPLPPADDQGVAPDAYARSREGLRRDLRTLAGFLD